MILSKENLKHIDAVQAEQPDQSLMDLPEKVLQFGTGVLLRGLPDYFIDKANKRGVFNGRIAVVKSTSGSTAEFDAQDNLYTLCVRGIERGQIIEENVICTAISRVVSAEKDWKTVLEIARSPELKVVISNTTEVGIVLLRESIDQQPPLSFPGKLLAVLLERYTAFEGSADAGLVIVATELIPENGKKLEAIVLELARENGLEQSFMNWMAGHIRFCNSLVDRIVPGKPDPKTLTELENELGYEDRLLAMAEPYRLWAIEGDEKVAALLDFGKVDTGVVVAEDIERFRELKVRLLNGTHTLSCGIAVLSGIDTVKNGMKNELLHNYIGGLMQEEIARAIPYPIELKEALTFAGIVLDRFSNPYIEHLWTSITLQYSMKMKIRIVPVLLKYTELYKEVPPYIAFGFAAFLHVMKSVQKDDNATYFLDRLNTASSEEEYVEQLLRDTVFWGADLGRLPGFIVAVKSYYGLITEYGIEIALSTFKNLTLNTIVE